MGTIKIFEGMFGQEFWNQAVIAFTRLSMDSKGSLQIKNKLKSLKVAKSKADGGVGDGSLDGGGVSGGGMNVCVCMMM